MFDFDTVQNRRDVNACKYIGVDDNITAMSVADMDFVVPEFIKNALYKRIDSVNYGYTMMGNEDYDAIIHWTEKRHGVNIRREHLLSTPGVLNTMRCSMYAVTEPGDKVVVILPLHTPSTQCRNDGTHKMRKLACPKWFRRLHI